VRRTRLPSKEHARRSDEDVFERDERRSGAVEEAFGGDERARRRPEDGLRDGERARRGVADGLRAGDCVRRDDESVFRGHERLLRVRADVLHGLKDALGRAADALVVEEHARRSDEGVFERDERPSADVEHAFGGDERARRRPEDGLRDGERARRGVADALRADECVRRDEESVFRGHERLLRVRADVPHGLKNALGRAEDALRRPQRTRQAKERVARPSYLRDRTKDCRWLGVCPACLCRKPRPDGSFDGEASTLGTVPGAEGLAGLEQAPRKETESPMSKDIPAKPRVHDVDGRQKLADGLTKHGSIAPAVAIACVMLNPGDIVAGLHARIARARAASSPSAGRHPTVRTERSAWAQLEMANPRSGHDSREALSSVTGPDPSWRSLPDSVIDRPVVLPGQDEYAKDRAHLGAAASSV
jgi:hypothetical protein